MPDASHPIFMSYSREDQGYVKSLISAFEARGLSVWLDDRIDYGAAWQREIEKHLRACQVFCAGDDAALLRLSLGSV